jgi:hypothetical protein
MPALQCHEKTTVVNHPPATVDVGASRFVVAPIFPGQSLLTMKNSIQPISLTAIFPLLLAVHPTVKADSMRALPHG